MIELQEIAERMWNNLVERPTGPMGVRFIIQPFIASILAVRDGSQDARRGRAAYFWTMVTNPSARMNLLREGLVSVTKVMVLAIVLDVIYQWIVWRHVYPVEAVIVALSLAYVPYLLVRGPAMRIVFWWNERQSRAERISL